jgi:hypothetical protein
VASDLPIQIIGDPAYPETLVPNACMSVPKAEDTIATFGANAVLGVSDFAQDCGPFCTQQGSQDGSAYSACTGTAPIRCSPAAVALAQQIGNPVTFFPVGNNGVLIEIDAVGDAGVPSASGTLILGIRTQANNTLGPQKLYTDHRVRRETLPGAAEYGAAPGNSRKRRRS